jgi:hypothetical protein
MGISMAAARKEAVQDASKREDDTRPSTGDSSLTARIAHW